MWRTFFDIGLISASLLLVTTNSILSPALNIKESQTDLGMVTQPFVVIVATAMEGPPHESNILSQR
jgi:hypothetical protein